jgi:hypothetical protein
MFGAAVQRFVRGSLAPLEELFFLVFHLLTVADSFWVKVLILKSVVSKEEEGPYLFRPIHFSYSIFGMTGIAD